MEPTNYHSIQNLKIRLTSKLIDREETVRIAGDDSVGNVGGFGRGVGVGGAHGQHARAARRVLGQPRAVHRALRPRHHVVHVLHFYVHLQGTVSSYIEG